MDPLAWARRVAPRPGLIFLGFMLPILLSSLVLLCLRWQDMRWQPAPVAVFLGMLGVAALCARCLSEVRMTRRTAAGLAVANTVMAAVGTLAVAPGTTDASAYWVAGDSGIVIAAVYFIRGPVPGLTTLAADLAALLAGLLVTGRAIARRRVAGDRDQPCHRCRAGGRFPGRLPRPVQVHRISARRVRRAAAAAGQG